MLCTIISTCSMTLVSAILRNRLEAPILDDKILFSLNTRKVRGK